MHIITVTGFKGGIGKSTTAIHLATFFSEKGSTVLVDGDLNKSSISWYERQPSAFEFEVADQRKAMRAVQNKDFIIIDTPARPDSEDLSELSDGCDLLVLPTSPDVVSLEPMTKTAAEIPEGKYYALITLAPPPPNRDTENLRRELKRNDIPTFNTYIRRSVGYTRVAAQGIAIKDADEKRIRNLWKDYENLGHEICKILEVD